MGSMMDIRHRMLSNAPHLETAQGSVASFSANVGLPLKSVVVTFEPTQEGSGDPDPDNVRNIIGLNSVTISHSCGDVDNSYQVSFPAGAGTVYGGYVDPVKGELVCNVGRVDLGTVNCSMSSSGNRFVISNVQNFKTAGSLDERLTGLWCPIYKMSSVNDATRLDDLTMIRSNTSTYNCILRNTNCSSANDFKTAMSGIYLYYLLDTPITYRLTPIQIKAMKGSNSIWSNTGETTVVYWTH